MKRIILTATLILLSLFIFSQNTNQTDKKTSVDKNTKTTDFGFSINPKVGFYKANKDIDTSIINQLTKDIDPMLNSYKSYLAESLSLKEILSVGTPSPVFEDYENYKGGKTSLSDLKGKYVYVDVWATWCGPCKAEIPSLKELEKKYQGKSIHFVSISIDDDRSHGGSWDKAHEDWKAMVADKELGGIQVFADNDWKSEFVQAYKINGIPRFILIDPAGNIVAADAPRPSSLPAMREWNTSRTPSGSVEPQLMMVTHQPQRATASSHAV